MNNMKVLIMNKLLPHRICMDFLRRSMCTGVPKKSTEGDSMSPKCRTSNFNKFILVWTKKYKSKEDVPDFVSHEMIERSRSEARIKIANVLMLLTALASLGAILSGKAAAKRGESVHQMNLDWHKQYNDEHAAKTSASQQ